MKAEHGNLRLDQKYTLSDVQYLGKYAKDEINLDFCQCENCGNAITNVMIVKGSEDGKTYRIGTDCAAVLTCIEPSEVEQAKKLLRKRAKMMKEFSTVIQSFVIEDDGQGGKVFYAYPFDIREAKRSHLWKWRGRYDLVKNAIEKTGKPVYAEA